MAGHGAEVAMVTEIRPWVDALPIWTSTRCAAKAARLCGTRKLIWNSPEMKGGATPAYVTSALSVLSIMIVVGSASVTAGFIGARPPVTLAGVVEPPPVPKIETMEPPGAGFAGELRVPS